MNNNCRHTTQQSQFTTDDKKLEFKKWKDTFIYKNDQVSLHATNKHTKMLVRMFLHHYCHAKKHHYKMNVYVRRVSLQYFQQSSKMS